MVSKFYQGPKFNRSVTWLLPKQLKNILGSIKGCRGVARIFLRGGHTVPE